MRRHMSPVNRRKRSLGESQIPLGGLHFFNSWQWLNTSKKSRKSWESLPQRPQPHTSYLMRDGKEKTALNLCKDSHGHNKHWLQRWFCKTINVLWHFYVPDHLKSSLTDKLAKYNRNKFFDYGAFFLLVTMTDKTPTLWQWPCVLHFMYYHDSCVAFILLFEYR